ncbi:MAG: diaminopimelate epimerase [Dehalococcoidales bacterium]|nr:diaminopimelate epimerase [Dehalococcoidales bacterium]
MNFTKMQGAGNDFVLVAASDTRRNWSRVAMAMCNRRFGVGADGLLLLLPSRVADLRMRMFNPDGAEAEACGNGLRCLVKYAITRGQLANTNAREIAVETIAGVRKASINRTKGQPPGIQVSLGIPEFRAEHIPVVIEDEGAVIKTKSMLSYRITIGSQRLLLNFVALGNPHAVYFSELPVADFPLAQLGPKIERHQLFPKRVNLEVAQIINRRQIEARVWERGAGETLACGSGAGAVAIAAQLVGSIDNSVDINMPGGILEVDWDGIGEVFLGGPAEIVFSGEWPE